MSNGLEPLVAAAWIVRQLTTDAPLATALGLAGTAALPSRVWQGDAPLGTPEPFIVFNAQSPGQDAQGVNAAIIFTDPLYTVRVVKQTADASSLASAAARIHARLHQQQGTVALGGTVIAGHVAAARSEPFYMEYNDAQGHPYRALGGIYRLYVDT